MLDGEARSLISHEEIRKIYVEKERKTQGRKEAKMNTKRSLPQLLDILEDHRNQILDLDAGRVFQLDVLASGFKA